MPFTYSHRSPFTYQAREPNNARQPVAYRSPFTYRNPVSAQQPVAFRSPFTYPNTYPANAQQPVAFRSPFTYPNTYPANAQQPNSARQPVIYQARQPIYFPPPPGCGCFVACSMVWLADGSHAPIETITEGQYLWSWNESSNLLEPKEVFVVMQPRMCQVYDITLSDGRIMQTTAEHPFMINELGGWGSLDPELAFEHHDGLKGEVVEQLEVGTKLFSMNDAIMFDRADSQDIHIVSIEEHSEMQVFNVSGVKDNHNYFVNGMLVHNLEHEKR